MEVTAQKISKKSLFKLLFIGFFIGLGSFAIICGIAALFGAETVTWNDEVRTGIEGLLYGLLLAPTLAILFTVLTWLPLVFGLWVYSFIRPIKITFKDLKNQTEENV